LDVGESGVAVRKYVFDLAGEGQLNDDGGSRQQELWRCYPGEVAELIREPRNRHDPNAISVRSARGVCIGYIARDDAAGLAPIIDAGRHFTAQIHELRGGIPDYPSYGCRVSIAWDGKPLRAHVKLRPDQIAAREDATLGTNHTPVIIGLAALAIVVILFWLGR
jgi:HIRAN domain